MFKHENFVSASVAINKQHLLFVVVVSFINKQVKTKIQNCNKTIKSASSRLFKQAAFIKI